MSSLTQAYSRRKTITPFQAEGYFLGFEPHEKGKLKYFHLSTEAGDWRIKLAKPLRGSTARSLVEGQWLKVEGETKAEDGILKHKAWFLHTQPSDLPVQPLMVPTPPVPKSIGTIQICQKSDCCKRGGSQVMAALKASLDAHPDAARIKIKPTGCMKDCKKGPNLVVMPAKARYQNVTAVEVRELIQRHFPLPLMTDPMDPAPQDS